MATRASAVGFASPVFLLTVLLWIREGFELHKVLPYGLILDRPFLPLSESPFELSDVFP